jgi:hypothetical protein
MNICMYVCIEFFKILKILPFHAQYIYSLLMFVVNNRNLFWDNADLYSIKTRNRYNLYLPLPHLTKYQTGYIMMEYGSSIACQLP